MNRLGWACVVVLAAYCAFASAGFTRVDTYVRDSIPIL
jgi:hypothetical protein